MVNARKLTGWILSGDALNQLGLDEEDGDRFVDSGVSKGTIYLCEYCNS